ncbi:MAG: hypothetical protein AzoDbin1_02133 [Azoarcus sp.]|nr:hypothetical protein [Azoarcus sp.]
MADENRRPPMSLALQAIYLRESHCRIAEWFNPTIPGTELAPVFRSAEGRVACNTTTFHDDDDADHQVKWCGFVSHFQFAYVRTDEEGNLPPEDELEQHIAAEISADIAADYTVGAPDFPPLEDLKRWGAQNVMLHSWPYWREFCQNAMLRMNLPITMIPLIDLTPKPETEE